MATPGPINRTLLQSFYQNAGDVYSDEKTEGAFATLADQSDANWSYLAGLLTSGTLSPYPQFFLYRQAVINGNFDVWQRGTVFNTVTTNAYTADRWKVLNSIDDNLKILQSTDVPNVMSKYSMRLEQMTAIGGVNASSTIYQLIEAFNLFAGQNVTLSGYIKCDIGVSAYVGINDSASTTDSLVNSNVWTPFSVTRTIYNATTSLYPSIRLIRNGLAIGKGINISQLQLNFGDKSIPFQPKSFIEELINCQRYYFKTFPYATAPVQNGGYNGAIAVEIPNSATSNFSYKLRFPVPMRTTPTVTTYNPLATNANWRDAINAADRAVLVGDVTDNSATIRHTVAAGAANSYNAIHVTADAEM